MPSRTRHCPCLTEVWEGHMKQDGKWKCEIEGVSQTTSLVSREAERGGGWGGGQRLSPYSTQGLEPTDLGNRPPRGCGAAVFGSQAAMPSSGSRGQHGACLQAW